MLDQNDDSDTFELTSQSTEDEEEHAHQPTPRQIDPNALGRQNFYFGKTLGEGSYARVVHAMMKNDLHPEYAIKIMEKSHIHKEKKVSFVMMEKQILSRLSHPFIIKLYYTFHDKEYLYMCMDLAGGGELSKLIETERLKNESSHIKHTACNIPMTRFYMAELTSALEYLHANNIIHMDLKPENVLITSTGHIKLADFGTSLKYVPGNTSTEYVGTALYVSPEVLYPDKIETPNKYSPSCDMWALGCIVYEMLCGISPFAEDTEYLIYKKIDHYLDGTEPIIYHPSIDNDAHSLIQALLQVNPNDRLSTLSPEKALQNHIFFIGIDWDNLINMTPSYIPNPSEIPDTRNMKDGEFDDWMDEGDATLIYDNDDLTNGLTPSTQCTTNNNNSPNNPVSGKGPESKWSIFLSPGEAVIFSGTTWKRKGLFSKKRQLILTSTPRLIYVDATDPKNMELKGHIPWTCRNLLKVVPLKGEAFDIVCTETGRSYHFTNAGSEKSNAKIWQQYIDDMNDHFDN